MAWAFVIIGDLGRTPRFHYAWIFMQSISAGIILLCPPQCLSILPGAGRNEPRYKEPRTCPLLLAASIDATVPLAMSAATLSVLSTLTFK